MNIENNIDPQLEGYCLLGLSLFPCMLLSKRTHEKLDVIIKSKQQQNVNTKIQTLQPSDNA